MNETNIAIPLIFIMILAALAASLAGDYLMNKILNLIIKNRRKKLIGVLNEEYGGDWYYSPDYFYVDKLSNRMVFIPDWDIRNFRKYLTYIKSIKSYYNEEYERTTNYPLHRDGYE